jgi:hypothetical protein
MADVTFRDFAGAIMTGNVEAAGAVLEQLLGLPAAESVSGGSAAEIGALLHDCFGLADAPLAMAVATLQRKPS